VALTVSCCTDNTNRTTALQYQTEKESRETTKNMDR